MPRPVMLVQDRLPAYFGDKTMTKKYTGQQVRKEEKRDRSNSLHECYVCKKHHHITEKHHIFPLRWLSQEISRSDITTFSNKLIYLCPNCHRYVHRLIREMEKCEVTRFFQGSEEEARRLKEVADTAFDIKRQLFPETILDVFFNEKLIKEFYRRNSSC